MPPGVLLLHPFVHLPAALVRKHKRMNTEGLFDPNMEETARASHVRDRPENVAFVTRANPAEGHRDKNVTYGYCKKLGHDKDNCFQLHGYLEGWGSRTRGGGGRGRSRGRGFSSGRGAGPAMAHAATVTPVHGGGQEPAVTTVPTLTAEQWDTFQSLLASVKDGSTEKLSGSAPAALEFRYIDDDDHARSNNIFCAGPDPVRENPADSTASSGTENSRAADNSMADPPQLLSIPPTFETSGTMASFAAPRADSELGRGHRSRTPNVRLQDYVTYIVTTDNHSCQYPLTKFVDYARFSDYHRSYLAKIDCDTKPKSYREELMQAFDECQRDLFRTISKKKELKVAP
ncbi:unnamed protein product [Cuscuta campestris]|uniref:Uncharacterized protein n=1 Tax=Cuscuta campestris TaxID=132261 RepID=A0A484NC47_9ASTE|nr:unnamed protein product [Cuscuta campestris]